MSLVAQRAEWKTRPIDRTLAASLADRHIDMYLPDTAAASATAPIVSDAKREEQEAELVGLPSPQSLEVGDTDMGVGFGE